MAKCTLTVAQKRELAAILDKLDAAKSELSETLQTICDDWTEEIDESSERWRESAYGQAAVERRDQVQQWIDELEIFDLPDLESIQ